MRNISLLFISALSFLLVSLVSAQDTTMTITEDGFVGIGTTNPIMPLHVLGFEGHGMILESLEFGDRTFFYYAGEAGLVMDSWRPTDGRRLPLLFQPSGGSVGIGTFFPGSTLDVNGSIRAGDIGRFGNHMLSSRVAEDNANIDVAIFGSNEGTTGFEAGVYGRNHSPEGFGVYSEGNFGTSGNATINGNLRANGVNTGAEALKIVRGSIDIDGSIKSGTGFTVTKDDVGTFTITFDQPFSDYPSVSGSTVNPGVVTVSLLAYGTYVQVRIERITDATLFDSFFTFMAIGGAGGEPAPGVPAIKAEK